VVASCKKRFNEVFLGQLAGAFRAMNALFLPANTPRVRCGSEKIGCFQIIKVFGKCKQHRGTIVRFYPNRRLPQAPGAVPAFACVASGASKGVTMTKTHKPLSASQFAAILSAHFNYIDPPTLHLACVTKRQAAAEVTAKNRRTRALAALTDHQFRQLDMLLVSLAVVVEKRVSRIAT
jgi:hypothetical protein